MPLDLVTAYRVSTLSRQGSSPDIVFPVPIRKCHGPGGQLYLGTMVQDHVFDPIFLLFLNYLFFNFFIIFFSKKMLFFHFLLRVMKSIVDWVNLRSQESTRPLIGRQAANS